MSAISSWVVMGALVGLVADTVSDAELPGGRLGSAIVGAAGAFVGGGVLTLFADRSLRGVDLLALAVAAVTAAVVVRATTRAHYAEPRPPEAYSRR